jgi:hypothetical protein
LGQQNIYSELNWSLDPNGKVEMGIADFDMPNDRALVETKLELHKWTHFATVLNTANNSTTWAVYKNGAQSANRSQ